METPGAHDPGHQVGWLVAALTGMFSVLRALVSRRRPEPEKEDELEAALQRGSRRSVLQAQLDEQEIRLERLETGRLRSEAGIERVERLLTELRDDVEAAVRHLRRVIDEKCSDSTGRDR